MRTPVIETERLILRPLVMDDAEAIYRGWTSDPEVAKYMVWDIHSDVSDTEEWLEFEISMDDNPDHYNWGFILKETGELIGSGGIIYLDAYEMHSIGYNFMQKYWRRGLGREAAERIVKFAVEEVGIEKLFAKHDAENVNSGKILEKLGFKFIGNGMDSTFTGSREFETCEYILKVEK